jgi:precorrin-6A/cobalt-precorrin-6A reductase
MILLLGGTGETVAIATALADAGYRVLLSTATTQALRGKLPAAVRRRCGPLDAAGLSVLFRTEKISLLIDATHPYAAEASANAYAACRETGISFLAYDRPSTLADLPDVIWADDHAQAAALACSFGRPMLLTIGTRHLPVYVAEARKRSIPLVARILDQPDSLDSARRAGLLPSETVVGLGPFSIAQNAALIAEHRIGVLVTKDSGAAGGVDSKIEAARAAGCRIVVVRRPARPQPVVHTIAELVRSVRALS